MLAPAESWQHTNARRVLWLCRAVTHTGSHMAPCSDLPALRHLDGEAGGCQGLQARLPHAGAWHCSGALPTVTGTELKDALPFTCAVLKDRLSARLSGHGPWCCQAGVSKVH